jgi:hypothetical protein
VPLGKKSPSPFLNHCGREGSWYDGTSRVVVWPEVTVPTDRYANDSASAGFVALVSATTACRYDAEGSRGLSSSKERRALSDVLCRLKRRRAALVGRFSR